MKDISMRIMNAELSGASMLEKKKLFIEKNSFNLNGVDAIFRIMDIWKKVKRCRRD